MLFSLPIIFLLLAALTLLVLRFSRPGFKYPWVIALGGSILAFAGVFLWHLRFPASVSLPAWQPLIVFRYIPTWSADGVSWPYSLSLAALAAAIILTSIVRNVKDPLPWAGTLSLTALGILAVSSGDPLTLILTWTAIDLVELITMLITTEGEKESREVIVAFAVRVVGTGFVIWASAVGSSAHLLGSFDHLANNAGIYLLFASGLRLGVLPLHLPYHKENVVRRGFGTSLRLVSASASLALLARIPVEALDPRWTPYLLALTAIPAIYAGWMWLRASDEIVGRPFLVLGMAALAMASTLRASPSGSIGWGVALILCGGLIFLYSSRQRTILWLPLLGLWGFSAFPYSLSAAAWETGNHASGWFLPPFLLAQALLIAGFFRHTLHPGETSFESQERWARILYPAGLVLLTGCSIMLGFWGWDGALNLGLWWTTVPVILLAMGTVILTQKFPGRTSRVVARWGDILRLDVFSRSINFIVRAFEGLTRIITSTLEGEGGIFWSILLLVLLLSLLSARGG
jgi:hypothetical protein